MCILPYVGVVQDAMHATTPDEHARLKGRLESERIGFRYHAIAYVLTNLVFLAMDVYLAPGVVWIQYPVLGWGAGLTVHYLAGPRLAAERLEALAGAR